MKKDALFTSVALQQSDVKINHQESILLLGSCFTQNIGQKLKESKFNANINPFGIIYNPVSSFKALNKVVENEQYLENKLFQNNKKWLSFDHHGSFSSFDKQECLTNVNASIEKAHLALSKTKTIFITFGSAWVYEYPEVGIVANCHKIPNNQFTKRLLSVKEILLAFDAIKEKLKEFNLVFTVSPVRHVKDGLHNNNLSKATLLLAINNIVAQNENCHYFPAYELVIDELRDYRFFKDDLVHPTAMAVNFIWDKFVETYCNNETTGLIAEIQQIKQAVNHKPFYFESEEHQQFIKTQLKKMAVLSEKYSFLNFEEEKFSIKVNEV